MPLKLLYVLLFWEQIGQKWGFSTFTWDLEISWKYNWPLDYSDHSTGGNSCFGGQTSWHNCRFPSPLPCLVFPYSAPKSPKVSEHGDGNASKKWCLNYTQNGNKVLPSPKTNARKWILHNPLHKFKASHPSILTSIDSELLKQHFMFISFHVLLFYTGGAFVSVSHGCISAFIQTPNSKFILALTQHYLLGLPSATICYLLAQKLAGGISIHKYFLISLATCSSKTVW